MLRPGIARVYEYCGLGVALGERTETIIGEPSGRVSHPMA